VDFGGSLVDLWWTLVDLWWTLVDRQNSKKKLN